MKTFWTEEEKKRFCELYPVTETEDLCKIFNMPISSIRQRAKFYKVKKTPEAITRAQSISRLGKSHSKKRKYLPEEEPLNGVLIPTGHGVKAVTTHSCGTITVHRMR